SRIIKQDSIVMKDRAEAPSVIESTLKLYARGAQQALQEIPVQNVVKVKAATIPGSDSIELGIQVTLSNVIGETEGAPNITANSMQTQVTVRNGESAALGGHMVDQALGSYNGGSKSHRHDKHQYIIFITPEAIHSAE